MSKLNEMYRKMIRKYDILQARSIDSKNDEGFRISNKVLADYRINVPSCIHLKTYF